MADLSQPLDQIAVAQAQPAVTANELIDALSPSALYGRRAITSAGLTWGYNGGRFNSTLITPGTVSLTNAATNYVVALRSTGAVSVSTSITNWNDTATYLRLYLLTTVGSVITVREDHRQSVGGSGSGGTFTGGTLTSAVNEAPIVTVASATTTNAFAAASNTLSISGTTTIAGFDTAASGFRRRIIFEDVLQLTHHATSMILPTGANITTAAGDTAEIVSLGSGNTRITDYMRKSGAALVAGSATPGGSDTQVQFNDASAFGGDAGLVYNKTTDTLTGVNITATALSLTAASATGGAGFRVPHGVAPTSPTNGDFWSTTTGFFGRVNGSTVAFGSGGSAAGSTTEIQYNNAGAFAGSSKFTWDDSNSRLEFTTDTTIRGIGNAINLVVTTTATGTDSGTVTVRSGVAGSGNSGIVNFGSGDALATGVVTVSSGNSSASFSSGDVLVTSGTAATNFTKTGKLTLGTGVSSGGGGTAGGGRILLLPGTGQEDGSIGLFSDPGSSGFGGGELVLFIGNSPTIPTSNPVGGGFLFADAGALKWRGSSGTVTTIAPA